MFVFVVVFVASQPRGQDVNSGRYVTEQSGMTEMGRAVTKIKMCHHL